MEERKRMKKFSILLLALLLVFGSIGNVFATVGTSRRISVTMDPYKLKSNQNNQSISFTLKNNTTDTIYNVEARIKTLDGKAYVNGDSPAIIRTFLGDASESVSFVIGTNNISANDKVKVSLEISYDGLVYRETEGPEPFTLQLSPPDAPVAPAVVETTNLLITANQTTLLGNLDRHNIFVNVENLGNAEAKNVVAKAFIANPTTVFLDGYTATNLGNIGNSKAFTIPVKTLPTDKDVTVEINIELSYNLADGTQKTQSEKIYVIQKATKLPENSILEIKKIDSFPLGYVVPGENFNVAFEIYNPGNAPARNVKLMLEGLEPTGINMKTGLNTQDLTMIPAKSKATVFYELTSPASAAGGMYQLNLKYSFVGKTPTGGETMAPVTGEYKFSVDMKKASMAPSTIIFDRVTFPKGQIGKNRNVDVSFTLKNIGTSKAQNLKISAVSENTAAVSPTSGSNAIVKELDPGQSAEYKFSFKTTNSATTGNYPVNFTVEYIDDSTTVDKPHKITQTVGINVIDWEAEALKNKDKPTSTPKLIVEKYEFIPNVIYAGTTFNMNLVLYNTNDTKIIENVKIFLTSETMQSSSTGSTTTTSASVFTPINSSNTFHIDSIAPGERIEKTITLGSSRDTAAKTYTVTANLEYEDRQANKFTSQEIIGVPVLQESKIGMGEITMDPQYTVGMPGNLSVDFYNTGKVALSNFMVNIEGEGIKADTPTYYKGNFPSGTSDTFSVNITPESPEATKGKIRFTFEDSTGESHEIEKEFTIEVMDMSEMYPEGMDPNMPPMPPEDQGGLPILPIAAGAAALGVGGFIFWRRRKVKKDEEDLTIDED